MANTSVGYNWTETRGLARTLGDDLSKFESQVEALYAKLSSMREAWNGPSFDAFLQFCENYRSTEIRALIGQVQDWIDKVNKLADLQEAQSEANKGVVS